MIDRNQVKFNRDGLVPVVVQDYVSRDVLMLAYMNSEALSITMESGWATYFSRSRQSLWKKGETSGNLQTVRGMYYDCDRDTILLLVDQSGVACHTGSWSCFLGMPVNRNVLQDLYQVIEERKASPTEGSYTTYLFDKGIDKILKKVGEESSEVIIAAKNNDPQELIYEASDLTYHLLVLLVEKGVSLSQIEACLREREGKVKS